MVMHRCFFESCRCILDKTIMAMPQHSTSNGFDLNEVWYVVIGAGIGFIASIGTIAIERLLDRRGRIKLYYKVIGDRDATFPNGFHYTQNGDMSFSLPMQVEIQNTSKVTRVIRDINIDLYLNGQFVDHMTPVESTTNRKTTNGHTTQIETQSYGADNGAYSFVVEPLSILHQNCYFFYIIKKENTFDEAKLRYFDEKDRPHSFSIRKIGNCWREDYWECTDEWILLK